MLGLGTDNNPLVCLYLAGVSHVGGLTDVASCRSCKQGSPGLLNHKATCFRSRTVTDRPGPSPHPATGLPPSFPLAGGPRLCFSAMGRPSGEKAFCLLTSLHVGEGEGGNTPTLPVVPGGRTQQLKLCTLATGLVILCGRLTPLHGWQKAPSCPWCLSSRSGSPCPLPAHPFCDHTHPVAL